MGKDLTELSNDVIAELARLNYTAKTIKGYRNRFNQFIEYAVEQGQDCFSEELGLEFLESRYKYSEQIKDINKHPVMANALRVIRLLGDYNLHEAIIKRRPRSCFLIMHPEYADIHSKYKQYCAEKGYANGTCISYQKTVEKFFAYLETHGSPHPCDILPVHVNGYINTLVGYSYKTNELYLCAIRSLLRFLYERGFHEKCLVSVVPKMMTRKYCKIPAVWNAEDVEKLLGAVDRGNETGKRDYAILLLVTRLGIRACDVSNLKFDHLCWNENKIEFIQSKTKRKINLPLLPDVGWAIIDYLQNGRPKISSPYVFLRHKPPAAPFSESYHLYGIMLKYAKLSGVRFPAERGAGLHSLRHTLASALLEKQTPLSTISEILGHVSSETTDLYLMTGVNMLRECSLTLKEMMP